MSSRFFIGGEISKPASAAELVRVICSRYRLPYFLDLPLTIESRFISTYARGNAADQRGRARHEKATNLRRNMMTALRREIPRRASPVFKGMRAYCQWMSFEV